MDTSPIEKSLKIYTRSDHADGSVILTYILPAIHKGKYFECVGVTSETLEYVPIFIIRAGTEELINCEVQTNHRVIFSEENHPFINAEDDFYTVAVHLSRDEDASLDVVAIYSDIDQSELKTQNLTLLPKFSKVGKRTTISKSRRKLIVPLLDDYKTYVPGHTGTGRIGDTCVFDYPLFPGPRCVNMFRLEGTYPPDTDIFLMYRNTLVSHIPYNNYGTFAPLLHRSDGKVYYLDLENIRPDEFYIRVRSKIPRPPLMEIRYGIRSDYFPRSFVNMTSPEHFEYNTCGFRKVPQRDYVLSYGPSGVVIDSP